ncbi:threonine dehydratase [Arthrobacter alpinus]|uniref:threonine/serine dehydratase n=1 Tax=Arthrobacter alpinus TaxID=656366 RepID=UPI0005CB7159|nr:threonine/serine dehydratase [Arthrobacter alpinus]ALV44930.1 threonine dehydratase [Arthrobacter alpinus]
MITLADVELAAARIAEQVRRTPVMKLDSAHSPGQVWLKCEFLQKTGTFKARGAFNRVLSAQERGEIDPNVGIAVASGGNAGLANAYAAAELGIPATVFVPLSSPAVKVAKLRAAGATVVQDGAQYADAFELAMAFVAETGAIYCHAYDQIEIASGAGTIGIELLEQLGAVDTVLVAVGGGGLMAGVAAALEGRAQTVAVEPSKAPSLHAALAAGEPVDVEVSGIAADSLGARRIGSIAFDVAVRTGVRSVLVSDEQIIAARTFLWENYRIALEHGAAAAFAALHAGAYVPAADERVAVILCGANTDPAGL